MALEAWAPFGRFSGAGWLALCWSLLPGCSDDGERVVEENRGTLCLYLEDQALRVEVRRTGCLSQSCDIDRVATCAVTAEGAAIHVESKFEFTSTSGSCTFDCGTLSASCTVPLTAEGDYDVTFGTSQLTLTIAEGEPALFGSGPPNACAR